MTDDMWDEDDDPIPNGSRHLEAAMIDCLLPPSLAIPMTDEEADVLETVRASFFLSYHPPGTDVNNFLRHTRHMSWPTDRYESVLDNEFAGSQVLMHRAILRTTLLEFLDEQWLTVDLNPCLTFMGRWYMAPDEYDPKGVWTGDGTMIYRLGSVNFTGYVKALLGSW